MRVMKILHVINPLLPGGAERMAVDLAVGMKQTGHSVTVLTLQETRTFFIGKQNNNHQYGKRKKSADRLSD